MTRPDLSVIDHALAADLLGRLRDRETEPGAFATFARRLAVLLVAEATRRLDTRDVEVTTPVGGTTVQRADARVLAVPVLRAGLGMLPAVHTLFPDAHVGFIGLERDAVTHEPVEYYRKIPAVDGALALVLEPMLATGGSAGAAIAAVREHRARRIVLVSVVAAPEGIASVHDRHPDVTIVTAAVDDGLNEDAYIVPGLGDFGDRLFGTHH